MIISKRTNVHDNFYVSNKELEDTAPRRRTKLKHWRFCLKMKPTAKLICSIELQCNMHTVTSYSNFGAD